MKKELGKHEKIQTDKIRTGNNHFIQRSRADRKYLYLQHRLEKQACKIQQGKSELYKVITTYPCGAVSYEVDKKRLSIRFTSPYSEERRAKARKYAREHNIVSNLNSRHFKR